jgi:DNA-binding CsgD family transcriptional regulator
VIIDEKDYLMHYGVLRRSGRYPWGSGGPEKASNKGFIDMVDGLRKSGMNEKQIADGLGISITQLRAAKSLAKSEQKQADIAMAERLKAKGYSNIAIGKRMNINESSVRALLAPGQQDKANIIEATTKVLKEHVAEKGLLDVGVGVERHMGISKEKLAVAVAALKEEGYNLYYIKVPQLGTGKETTLKVLAPPSTTYSQAFKDRNNIKSFTQVSNDGGRSWFGIQPPIQVSPRRIAVRYADQGGKDADGVIYVRPGVPDLSLGHSKYAQVRIAVGGTHYLKGMAMYKDDLPNGVDLVFNTSKHDTGNKLDAMKPLSDDPDNPFGAIVSQITKPGRDGKVRVTSAMNLVNEEGDWEKWSRTLSSQFLSKQSPKLAKTQLDMTVERKQRELTEILALTNPAVKKKLLDAFADGADSAAVHLRAASLPRQSNHVILPLNSLKENEIYAPSFLPGERVVLIRHPHGGIFEIPELTVNNKNPEGKKLLGDTQDAVGIHPKVAARLSGADFDGDTVVVIPNNHGAVKTKPALAGLTGFDPISAFPGYSGMTKMSAKTKQFEMGDISNLITDMTIRGANDAELARAVRHSMVVIDAEKHGLNYKQSAIDNGIRQLKLKYQGKADSGASTLISRARSRKDVPDRKPRSAAKGGPVNRVTGAKVFEPTGASFVNAKGKTIVRVEQSTKLAETADANTLSSGTPIEKIYADHSNQLKALANKARLESTKVKPLAHSPSAKKVYAAEVISLNHKLNVALKNAPLERNAQVLANAVLAQKKAANPNLEPSEIKRIKSQALEEARTRTGAKKTRIDITESEWAAIQAGAISNHRLSEILKNADLEKVKQLASPKSAVLMTSAKKTRARQMIASGYTQAEIANALGVSLTTLKDSLSKEV